MEELDEPGLSMVPICGILIVGSAWGRRVERAGLFSVLNFKQD
jgi:hypothetical protein